MVQIIKNLSIGIKPTLCEVLIYLTNPVHFREGKCVVTIHTFRNTLHIFTLEVTMSIIQVEHTYIRILFAAIPKQCFQLKRNEKDERKQKRQLLTNSPSSNREWVVGYAFPLYSTIKRRRRTKKNKRYCSEEGKSTVKKLYESLGLYVWAAIDLAPFLC